MPNIGIGHSIGFSEEATWGTVESTVDNFLDAEAGSLVVKHTSERIQGEELLYRGILSSSVAKGTEEVEGSLQFKLRYGGGWALFLAQLNGIDPTTAGAAPYTHTFNLGASIASGNNLTKGISLFADREGMIGGAGSRASAYTGVRPTAFEIAFEQNARAAATVEFIGEALDSFVTRPTVTLSSREFIVSPSSAASPTNFLTWNGTAYVVKSASVKIEQEHERRRNMQGSKLLQPVPSGLMKITGSFTCEAPATGATSGGAFYDDYNGKTLRQLVITADGATPASAKLALTLPRCLITASPEPEIAGAGVVMTTVEWEAYYYASDARIGQLVLTTDDSTAWA
jgi:hypothetical protein